MKRRALASILAILMLLSILPSAALAEDGSDSAAPTQGPTGTIYGCVLVYCLDESNSFGEPKRLGEPYGLVAGNYTTDWQPGMTECTATPNENVLSGIIDTVKALYPGHELSHYGRDTVTMEWNAESQTWRDKESDDIRIYLKESGAAPSSGPDSFSRNVRIECWDGDKLAGNSYAEYIIESTSLADVTVSWTQGERRAAVTLNQAAAAKYVQAYNDKYKESFGTHTLREVEPASIEYIYTGSGWQVAEAGSVFHVYLAHPDEQPIPKLTHDELIDLIGSVTLTCGTHTKGFTLTEGTYDMAQDGDEATVAIYGDRAGTASGSISYLAAFDDAFKAEHDLVTESVTVTLKYGVTGGWRVTDSSTGSTERGQIAVFSVQEKSDAPEFPMKSDLAKLTFVIECDWPVSVVHHNDSDNGIAGSLGDYSSTWDIVSTQVEKGTLDGQERYYVTVRITDIAAYVATFNSRYSGHDRAEDQEDTVEFRAWYYPESGKWGLADAYDAPTIHVICQIDPPTEQEVADALSAAGEVTVRCVTEPGHTQHSYSAALGMPADYTPGEPQSRNGAPCWEVELSAGAFVDAYSNGSGETPAEGEHTLAQGMPNKLTWVVYRSGDGWRAEAKSGTPDTLQVEHAQPQNGAISVTKRIAGLPEGVYGSEETEFVLQLLDGRGSPTDFPWTDGMALTIDGSPASADYAFTYAGQGWVFSLKDGETASFSGLAAGQYRVEEIGEPLFEKYALSKVTNTQQNDGSDDQRTAQMTLENVLSGDGGAYVSGASVTYTNTYTRKTGELTVRKTFKGITEKMLPWDLYIVITLEDGSVTLRLEEAQIFTVGDDIEAEWFLYDIPTGVYNSSNVKEYNAHVSGFKLKTSVGSAEVAGSEDGGSILLMPYGGPREETLEITNSYTEEDDSYDDEYTEYTVRYMRYPENVEIAPAKVVKGQLYGARITEHAIDIPFYVPFGDTAKSLTLTYGDNELVFYYTYWDPQAPALPQLNRDDHYAYVMGYPDGTFRPEASITRAEAASIFFRLLTDESRAEYLTGENPFSDVNEGDWYNTAISTLANADIVDGYEDGTFRPDAPITRGEMAKLAAGFAETDAEADIFSDLAGHWSAQYVALAAGNGWISGYPDGSFGPDRHITRAETVTMINRVLRRVPASAGCLLPAEEMTTFPDCLPEAWYYVSVQEAANSHSYELEQIGEIWTGLVSGVDWTRLEG